MERLYLEDNLVNIGIKDCNNLICDHPWIEPVLMLDEMYKKSTLLELIKNKIDLARLKIMN